jgi:Ca2+-binding RTX toxin-like protein
MLAFAAPASADTDIAVLGDTLFISSDGVHNSDEFKVVNEKYRTVDDGSTLVPGAGCAREPPADAHVVDCTGTIFKAIVGLGGGPDDFTPAPYIQLNIQESGEEGKDQLTGGLGDDTLRGNAGDDYSIGAGGNDFLSDGYAGTLGGGLGSGNDTLLGGAGNDYLDGGTFAATPDAGSGGDVLDGGPDLDVADYSQRTAPLTLTEGAGKNDGQDTGAGPGSEADSLVNAETILGGSGGDAITGAGEANVLHGGSGGDTLRGGGGADTVLGEDGNDTLDGGDGPDLLQGGHGTDTASYAARTQPVTVTLDSTANDGEAGEGDNVDDGTENVVGGAGNDTISVRDGATNDVTCGAGADQVVADAFDVVAADCETVDRGTLPQPGPGRLAALRLPKSIRVRHARARVKVICPKSALGGCAKGRLAALKGKRRLARSRFSVGAGDSAVVTLTFKRRARAGKLKKVTLKAAAVGAAPVSRRVKVRH